MPHSLIERIIHFWKELDLSGLEEARSSLAEQNSMPESRILEALIHSLSGRYSQAITLYSAALKEPPDFEFHSIAEIDRRHCMVKAKKMSSRSGFMKEILSLLTILLKTRGLVQSHLVHHYLYTWYFEAFWRNHYESLFATLLLFVYGAIFRVKESFAEGLVGTGHVLNIMGVAALGVPLAKRAIPLHSHVRPWCRVHLVSVAYGLYVIGRGDNLIPQLIANAEAYLQKHPDPFFRIIFLVTKLRFASQNGDITSSEAAASELVAVSEPTSGKWFLMTSKADLALCYGIRGLYWHCEKILKELESFNPVDLGAPEAGGFYRLRGWSYFFCGDYDRALADAESAIQRFKTCRSFWLGREMARFLRCVAEFRIRIKQVAFVEQAVSLAKAHCHALQHFSRRYRGSTALSNIVREEQQFLRGSFQRLSQPGYSREASVIKCQQNMFEHLHSVVNASTDDEAWKLIGEIIQGSLGARLVSLVRNVDTDTSVIVRLSPSFGQTAEMLLERAGLNETFHDVAYFASSDKYTVASLMDSLFTLHPTIDCIFKIRDLQNQIILRTRDAAIAETAVQVAHDIRSPLAALEVVAAKVSQLPEGERILVRGAIQRVKDIANDLSRRAVGQKFYGDETTTSVRTSLLLSGLIEDVLSEKRAQYRSRLGVEIIFDMTEESYGLFASVDPSEMKRVLSNLISNSVEALPESGKIILKLGMCNGSNSVYISVADNGKGIPADKLPRVTQKGVTYGKAEGSGLGLYHAKSAVESWDGTLTIQSQEGLGTIVTLAVPQAEAPSWFVSRLMIGSFANVIVVDDDPSIHQVWQERFDFVKKEGIQTNIIHFAAPLELREWFGAKERGTGKSLFLIDYEFLGHTENGLDLIESLGISSQSILVTSHFEEESIRDRCNRLGVRLLPKGMAGFVPVRIDESVHHKTMATQPDVILIDDDDLTCSTWETRAKGSGKTIWAFRNPDDFYSVQEKVSPETPIYIDMHLGSNTDGKAVGRRLRERGFCNLYLTTGYHPALLKEELPWAKGILNKVPPF